MYGKRSLSWLPKVCSHELLDSSVTWQEKWMDVKFHLHILFGLRVIKTSTSLSAGSECTSLWGGNDGPKVRIPKKEVFLSLWLIAVKVVGHVLYKCHFVQ